MLKSQHASILYLTFYMWKAKLKTKYYKTYSSHDMAEKLLIWCWTTMTHSLTSIVCVLVLSILLAEFLPNSFTFILWYNWNIVESGVKHHKPTTNHICLSYVTELTYRDQYTFVLTCICLFNREIITKIKIPEFNLRFKILG